MQFDCCCHIRMCMKKKIMILIWCVILVWKKCVFFFFSLSEEKGIPVDTGSTTTSNAQGTTTSNLLPSGTALAATTATTRQNNINPLTQAAYSQRYHTLYRKRITLPVFEYRTDFMRLLAENQCIVLVGEVNFCNTIYKRVVYVSGMIGNHVHYNL